MWDPAIYLTYANERGRPFHDLIARVGAEKPRGVVDLGCGPGTLTTTLAARWPHARITGVDSSPDMIATARSQPGPARFELGDVSSWRPAHDTDVVLCNATLQWVPGHEELLTRWIADLPRGAWLAFQVPGNFGAASHRTLRTLANEPAWRETAAKAVRGEGAVLDPSGYARLLLAAGCTVDAWETTYLHVLPAEPGGDHPVLGWMDGTALRPVQAALEPAAWAEFRAVLGDRLGQAYPVEAGRVLFPFRRIFVVARTA